MSRQEKDFIEAAERLAETKRTEDAKQQCLYDFGIAADYGYQYAVDKACELIEKLCDSHNIVSIKDGKYKSRSWLEEQIRKAMQ